MKLTLVLLLLCASVALLKAEEIEQDEVLSDETSVDFLYDGSLEDEVLGDEDDPAAKHKKRLALKRLGGRRICARVFVGCLIKTKARCKLVPVCKVHYFACRCIVKGVRKCRRFLRFVAAMRRHHHRHHRKHDEVEEDEDEDARKGGKKKIKALKKILKKCKRGYRRCSRGKKFCGKCLRGFGACVRKHFKKPKGQKGDEPEDADTIMADAAEHHEDEEETNEEETNEEELEDPRKRRHRKPSAALIKCGKKGLKCMLRARLNCRRQGRCVRRVMKCARRARRHRARKGGKKQ